MQYRSPLASSEASSQAPSIQTRKLTDVSFRESYIWAIAGPLSQRLKLFTHGPLVHPIVLPGKSWTMIMLALI
ncbi:MAG: hypothetical protein HOB98_09925 [Gammaproteobacteria bacterium]|nr:hypothetical protein [Gammaproteobacteria bacterium]MBT3866756.1 hypothetical protein [Gammaproteobacteria bacterium]MBT4616753.1 hypothetical protein [Gammaproteobacteria bacterium]MBT6950721.1 hypothetical protein [Gammaproteobacteria bacterium]MBT7796436.1 hypothetical protein [Gammaproteobacteria bacterium]